MKAKLLCPTNTNAINYDEVYPCNYDKGMPFESKEYGSGLILDCKPIKDQITKENFWIYTVHDINSKK